MILETLLLSGLLGYQIGDTVGVEARQVAGSRIAVARRAAADPLVRQALMLREEEVDEDEDAEAVAALEQAQADAEKACTERLRQLSAEDRLVAALWVVGAGGRAVCETSGERGRHHRHTGWRQVFLEERSTHVNMVTDLEELSEPGVQLSVPIRHEGRRLGAIVLTVRLHHWALSEGSKADAGH